MNATAKLKDLTEVTGIATVAAHATDTGGTADTPHLDPAPEWARVEVLARCLQASQAGQEPTEALLRDLAQGQARVQSLRGGAGPWSRLPTEGLPPLAFDLLACIYAAEAAPRVGWLYQELQPGCAHAFATPALLQQMLALETGETAALHGLVGVGGELLRRGLVELDGRGACAQLRPRSETLAVLLGQPRADIAPPGTVRVHRLGTWEELVLPPRSRAMLSEYLLWLRHRDLIVKHWGGAWTGGPVALLSGPSGTGKSFAAGVLAQELGWPLYRVDLASLVSKYIGETEKNIGQLLDAADGRELVLQFDEVDALMSKRGEVKEARDRYANMEVSYLLARIEEHRGPCILTTNLRQQIDKAFARRFQMVIEFPRPDVDSRRRLWQRMLPPRAPLSPEVDVGFLAAAVTLSGGNIRNAALHAAYLAAGDGTAIDLGHIALGVWRELAKERQQVPISALGALAAHLPQGIVRDPEE